MSGGAEPQSAIVTRPVAILMIFVSAVVFGWLSYGRLPVTLMPELTYPTLTVRTEYPGAAPEEVENDISRPVEEQLGVIAGLKRISSISRAGISDVVLEFGWETKMSDATQDVLEKLDLVFLPDEANRPLILHYDPSLDPVMELSLSGSGPRFEGESGLRRLRRLAELRIKKEIEPVKGVAAVRVRGGLEEEIHVALEEDALRRSGISIQQIIDRLGQENINVAGGTLKEGRTEYLVRTLNEYRDLTQIEDTVVANFDGRDVRIKDLAHVSLSHKEREILTRTNGEESVQIQIFKEGDANIVSLAKRVKALLGELPPEAPPTSTAASAGSARRFGPEKPPGLAKQIQQDEGVRLETVADRSLFIESSIREVRNTAVLGGILAVLVLYLFLRAAKPTAIIAVSIPMSLLITFAPLNLLDVSLNVMSLGGLALGVGMLVDCSIVVLESIYRCREEGDDVATAASRGTAEVSTAVIASTLTTVAVFFPMVFVEGIAGQAFGDLGFAVVVSLLASLAVALFFVPMLASRASWVRVGRGSFSWSPFTPNASWQSARADLSQGPPWLRRSGLLHGYAVARVVVGGGFELFGWLFTSGLQLFLVVLLRGIVPVLAGSFRAILSLPLKVATAFLEWLSRVYVPVVRWALHRPAWMLLVVVGALWLSWAVTSNLESELLPEVHQGEFTVEVALPVGTPLAGTDAVAAPIEKAILTERKHIRSLILTVGYDSASSERSDEGEHTARFKIQLEDTGNLASVEEAVIARLRQRFSGIPDLAARIVRPVLFSSKTPIEVEIQGDDLQRLRIYADRAAAEMASLEDLADVESSLLRGAPEVQVVYDRDRLARYELNIKDVANLVRSKVKGFEATRFNLQDRRIPIIVRLVPEDRETVDDIRGIIINPGGDRPIRLSAVADVTLGEGPSEVRRIDGQRVALVSANIASGSLSGATARIDDLLRRRIDWPADVSFVITGQNAEWQRSRQSLWVALWLSVFLVYVIMAAQFESLIHPLVIMLTIPLALLGTVVALWVLGISLSIVVFLGMIMLAGIVVNNAIVLVDYINTLRQRGMPREEAVVTAGAVRLRPILMTTGTTVLGLLPMALGLGDGAEIRTPLAIAVISGLISSTMLTLVVIPAIYMLAERIKERLTSPESAEPAVRVNPGAAVVP